MSKRRSWTVEELAKAIQSTTCVSDALNALKLKPAGGNYKQFYKYVEEHGLDTSHFDSNARKTRFLRGGSKQRIKTVDILVNPSYYNTNRLKGRLIKEGIKDSKCESCGNTEWLNLPIALELDHKNGNNLDNRIENLQLICPNCHAQTSNYRGKNKGNYALLSQRQRNSS